MFTYHQRSGKFQDKTGQSIATGYSGQGAGKNMPELQHVKSVGPLPRGLYKIGEPYDSDKVGPYCLPLTPLPDNEMLGRGDFRIHGDSVSHPGEASHGCIILNRTIRMQVWSSGDHLVEVVE